MGDTIEKEIWNPNAIIHWENRSPARPLIVNTDHRLHYRVIGKSRREGEDDLQRLTQTSPMEDRWEYVEGISQKTGEEIQIWYEVGVLETPIAADGYFTPILDENILKDLERLGVRETARTAYHFHPDDSLRGLSTHANQHLSNTPSETDYSYGPVDFFHYGDRPYPIDNRIVVPSGVWQITPLFRNVDTSSWYPNLPDLGERLDELKAEYRDYRDDCLNPLGRGRIPIISPIIILLVGPTDCYPEHYSERFSNDLFRVEFEARNMPR